MRVCVGDSLRRSEEIVKNLKFAPLDVIIIIIEADKQKLMFGSNRMLFPGCLTTRDLLGQFLRVAALRQNLEI